MALERISSHIQMRIAQIHANLKEGYSRIYMGGGTA
jgi:N-acetylmuramic acid 6-phosphate (MurNAc-6-P) etherase